MDTLEAAQAEIVSADPIPDVTARLRAIVGGLSRRLTGSARGSGLTPAQLSALGVIAREGPLRVSALAEIEGANPTMLSRVVGVLESQQLVRRRSLESDGRVSIIEVTGTGRRTHERLRQQRGRVISDALASLSTEQMRLIEAALPALEALNRVMKAS